MEWRITACTIRWMPGEGHHPESAERVEWTETRNLATSEGARAGRIMAATAEASPELKRLAGAAATGRKLEKPVCHYSLNWAKEEKPDRQEMSRAAEESLKALGMERHQGALIVSQPGRATSRARDPGKREGPERERAAWHGRRSACTGSGFSSGGRDLGKLERRSKREWSELYGRQERQREQLAKDCHGVLGRARWQTTRDRGTIRGRTEVLGRFRAELETRQRLERISLGKAHSEAVRKIESLAGEVYRGGQRDGRVRRRGGTPSQCMTVTVAETGAGSSARRRRSGWSRCGSSTESKLTRRRCDGGGQTREGQASGEGQGCGEGKVQNRTLRAVLRTP